MLVECVEPLVCAAPNPLAEWGQRGDTVGGFANGLALLFGAWIFVYEASKRRRQRLAEMRADIGRRTWVAVFESTHALFDLVDDVSLHSGVLGEGALSRFRDAHQSLTRVSAEYEMFLGGEVASVVEDLRGLVSVYEVRANQVAAAPDVGRTFHQLMIREFTMSASDRAGIEDAVSHLKKLLNEQVRSDLQVMDGGVIDSILDWFTERRRRLVARRSGAKTPPPGSP